MSILNIEIKKLPQSQVEILCEVSADEFESAYDKAVKEFNKKTNLSGFRPGHTPEKILIEKIGEEVIMERAVHLCIEKAYPEILKENKIDAVGRPQASITKIARNNPLGIKIITSVMPEIKLPEDYKSIVKEVMVKKEIVVVEDKEVEESLEYLRKSKERKKDAGPRQDPSSQENLAEPAPKPDPSPELNDEFAQSFGNFKTLDDLKSALRDNIKMDKEVKAREKKRVEVLEALSKKIKILIPEVFLENEKEKMIAELRSSIENMGMKWDNYLEHVKKSEEELKKGWDKEAENRVYYGFILREVADQEKLEPTEEEIEAHTHQILSTYPSSESAKIDRKKLKDYAYGILRNEKVFQLFESFSS
ncbi:MAG: hypothetical protein COU46_02925 [Candidatus Niyogibacteria bacterium CG10_big_fil_rev_8_21_14_0_10_42_19]|uniref:Trigger factor n=1 Tax=Candidatus Niyogibacteria bacterium CG10_big_fil_rev_8_21_14_0_10_42_19 TaxID=1974725 RepID=A0A2H0TF71_9BACT|nr:MAG: hypothetical protein COU46_02925 [Candidatus Niyogibacteria bacterium CG10_big_fil_rev_8_21_14_0_10_42_19]